jgi:hypothetical protein
LSRTGLLSLVCALASLFVSPLAQAQPATLRVADTIPDADSFIGRIHDLAVSGEGEVFVSDAKAAQVPVYTREGRLKRRIGRAGQGPGELLNVHDVLVKGDSLFVYNEGNRRVDVFETDGTYLEKFCNAYTGFFGMAHRAGTFYTHASRFRDPSFTYGLVTRVDAGGRVRDRFGPLYHADRGVSPVLSEGDLHAAGDLLVYVPKFYEEVRVFRDTTLAYTFDILNDRLADHLAANKRFDELQRGQTVFRTKGYVQASAVHDGVVYAAFEEPGQVRIQAYTVAGDFVGDYLVTDLTNPDPSDYHVRALAADDDHLYLGLQDGPPKVLVLDRPPAEP